MEEARSRALGLLLLLCAGGAAAQQDTLDGCLARVAADERFSPLAAKLSLGTQPASQAMLADPTLPDARAQKAIALWAVERSDCVKLEAGRGNPAYRPPLQAHRLDAESKVLEAVAKLYEGGVNYGLFNRQRRAIAEELRAQTEAVSRRIQGQREAQAQSDQQARDRQLLQKTLDETERQSARDQQEAANASRGPGRTYRRPAGTPYSSCFLVGGRLVCTYR